MNCRHHPRCPGCALASDPYDAQLRLKQRRLEDAVGRFPHLPAPRPIIGSAWQVGYRHRLKLPVAVGAKHVSIGLYGPDRKILDTPDCPVLAPELRDALPALTRWMQGKRGIHSLDLRVSRSTGELQAIFACAGGDLPGGPRGARALARDIPALTSIAVSRADPQGRRVMGSRPHVIAGKQALEESIGTTNYDLLPGAFFQTDPRQAGVLHGLVRDAVGDARTVLDLYAGVGAYALMLAEGRDRVVAVEEVAPAAAAARRRAPANVEVIGSRVEDLSLQDPFDVAILNPARRGSDAQSLARLAKLTHRLVYVSCGPETLARDLDVLATHGLRTVSLQPIDLFPQTPEVETVAILERGEPLTHWACAGGTAKPPWLDGVSGARGRPTKVLTLLVGRLQKRQWRSFRPRFLGVVATHSLVELTLNGTVRDAFDELAKTGTRPAWEDQRTRAFFEDKAGLQRPFVHVSEAGRAKAPLHGDLMLTLEKLRADRKILAALSADGRR